MTDLNLQHDNHQDNVNKKMLKYVESISTIALSNRSQIRDLQRSVKYFCFIIIIISHRLFENALEVSKVN